MFSGANLVVLLALSSISKTYSTNDIINKINICENWNKSFHSPKQTKKGILINTNVYFIFIIKTQYLN